LDVQLWLSRDAGRYRALLDQEGKESHVIRRREALPSLGSFDRGFSIKANSRRVLDPHAERVE